MSRTYRHFEIIDMRGCTDRQGNRCGWWVLFGNNYTNFDTLADAKHNIDRFINAKSKTDTIDVLLAMRFNRGSNGV